MNFDWQHTLEAIDADTDTGAVVPENVRGLYIKGDDGKFGIDPSFKKHVSGLTTALDKERKANRTVKDIAEKWAKLGETPEAVEQKLHELTEAAGKGDKVNFDKLKADLERGYAKKLEEKDGQLAAKDKTLTKYLVNSAAATAIAEAKGSAELLMPHVQSSVKVVEVNGEYVVRVVDADGDPRGDGKGGFMTVKDLIAEMKASPVYGRAFEASGTTGSGKQPGSGGTKPGVAGRDTSQMSPTQKIAAGLSKGLLRSQQ